MNWKVQWSKLHRKLGWWGAFAVLIWAISGLAHPLMSWFGPQAVKFYPPSLKLTPQQYQGLIHVIESNELKTAHMIKVIPSSKEALVQLTEGEKQPRRYFSLASGKELPGDELPNYDQQQAKWLASYYTGRGADEIEKIHWQTEFDESYPSVNRLLPVYRVRFAGGDGLTAYVYTETNALATLTNDFRQQLQGIFQVLHTWSWLNKFDNARVLLVGLFMLSLLAMCVAGIGLVIVLKSRRIPQASRRWHRVLSYALWLPLLGWSTSGFYHLLKAAYIEPVSGLRLSQEMHLDNRQWADINNILGRYEGQSINAVALIEGKSVEGQLVEGPSVKRKATTDKQQLFYRLSLSQSNNSQSHSPSERFSGKASEQSAVYINAVSGQLREKNDQAQARYLALQHTGYEDGSIVNVSKVARFGPDYDFRNKRLPVWRVDFTEEVGLRIFVDPTTGILVDQNRQVDRAESWSFSILHKWNHLNPIMGRFYRDVFIVGTLLVCLLMTVFGIVMLLKNRKRRNKPKSKPTKAQIAEPSEPALG